MHVSVWFHLDLYRTSQSYILFVRYARLAEALGYPFVTKEEEGKLVKVRGKREEVEGRYSIIAPEQCAKLIQ